MKRYEDSTLSYRCTGCGVSIYNADRKHSKCSECGYELIYINKTVKELKHGILGDREKGQR